MKGIIRGRDRARSPTERDLRMPEIQTTRVVLGESDRNISKVKCIATDKPRPSEITHYTKGIILYTNLICRR